MNIFAKSLFIGCFLIISGCANHGKLDKLNLPSWVLNPYEGVSEDRFISGIGVSMKPQIVSPNFKKDSLKYMQAQKDEAALHAKANIAEQIALEVVKLTEKESSKSSNKMSDEYSENLKQNIQEKVGQKLFGVKLINIYMSESDDSLFVRLVMPKSEAKKALKDLDMEKYSSAIQNINLNSFATSKKSNSDTESIKDKDALNS